ncbi:OmpA family protein [Pelotalea chapellei]|uniref:OmpA family protein n=1 Tax=Pelotalea chapellei TaxID=44671 RepID=A0ABS5U9S4_9BACT|nr:OmpA family protein [Pelotalea chapellei]MBT1072438.1 OmpA family protein [Pelotalea chapellei]
MKHFARYLLYTAMSLVVAMAVQAEAANREGQFSVSPVIGGITFDGPQHLATRPFFGIRGGYNFTDHLGVEALLDYARIDATRGGGEANFFRYGGELLYHFMPEKRLVPYVAAGYGGLNFDESRGSMFKTTKGVFDYGLGLKYFVTDSIALRGDVRHLVYKVGDTRNAVEYSLGLYIPFGGSPAAAAAVQPAPIVAEPAPAQAEPQAQPPAPEAGQQTQLQEPPLEPVPASEPQPGRYKYCIGLNIEFDIDKSKIRPEFHDEIARVGNFMKTYDTTTAVIEGHSDSVGTPEHNAKLSLARAESVKQYLVTTFGIDPARLTAKGYGPWRPVADNTTEAGKQKNRHIDAIIDCAFDVKEIKPPDTLCMQLNMEFDSNSTEIRPQYYPEIASVGEYMKKYPTVTALVEGHTDNVGGKEANLKISRQRAQHVVDYLVNTLGIDRSRLTAVGYGESRRVAYNSTPEGRQKNRRITVIMDCVVR